MPKYSYDCNSISVSVTSGTANVVAKIGSFTFSQQTMITAGMISAASGETGATTGAGTLFLKVDKASSVVFPAQDVFLTCALVATTTGVVGENKIQFSTKDFGIIIEKDDQVGLYLLPLANGLAIKAIATIISLPTTTC